MFHPFLYTKCCVQKCDSDSGANRGYLNSNQASTLRTLISLPVNFSPMLVSDFFEDGNLIFNKVLYQCFEYVVRKQDQEKVCFGSGCSRDTWSRKGMSPFMRHYAFEEYPNISPGKYNVLETFKTITTKPCAGSISKKGYSGIARFGFFRDLGEDFPAPCDYSTDTFPSKVKESKYPFASSAKRRTDPVNKNPGPGTYVDAGKRGINFHHTFGGRVRMRLGVELKCCKRNTDTCIVCEQKPLGDYWHWNNKLFLCRSCMAKERHEHSKFTEKDLKFFRKIRDCSEIHTHEGTDAKLWLVHPKVLQKRCRREAYLCSYLND